MMNVLAIELWDIMTAKRREGAVRYRGDGGTINSSRAAIGRETTKWHRLLRTDYSPFDADISMSLLFTALFHSFISLLQQMSNAFAVTYD